MLGLLGAAGCGPRYTDTALPVVQINKPTHHQQFLSGDTLAFEALLTDNNGLLNYVVLIEADDAAMKTSGTIAPWSYASHKPVSGTSTTVAVDIAIPLDVAAGEYTLTTECTDGAGNDALQKRVSLIVKNATDLMNPMMVITSLSDSQSNNYLTGSVITIEGTLTDNAGLGLLDVVLLNASEGVEYETEVDLDSLEQTIAHDFTAPAIPGYYTLRLVCHDRVNNIIEQHFDITLL